MRSSFSKFFIPTVIVLLTTLLIVGFFFQYQVRNTLTEQTMVRLEKSAETIAKLSVAYNADQSVDREAFVVNISVAVHVSDVDAVLCDSNGKLVLCADEPFGCEHQGLMISEGYLNQVFNSGKVRSTGRIQGLYADSRYLVGMPIIDGDGNRMGIVMVSYPMTGNLTVLSKMSRMYLFTSFLVIALAAIIMWHFARRQSTPLRDMAKAARAFGHGDLEARVRVDSSSSDEVQELAIAFNNMASSLQKSEYQRQEFVANVSHELKTPMTTISGFVDGILDGTIPPHRQQYYLKMVSDETKRLSRLVRSMLDISRLQDQGGIPEEKKERFDLTETVGQVLITFEQKIMEKKLDVQVQMPEHPVYTNASADALTQVVYNLVDNGVKFCPEGGRLGVKIREAGQKIYVSISNDGQTIPAQELPLVFERFHKLDKSRSQNREGWGLGLYIVKTIICSHGEDISVSSRDGVTEFTFTMPKVN